MSLPRLFHPRRVRRGALMAAAIGVLILFMGWILFQRLQISMIFPGHATQGTALAHVAAPAGCRLVPLTTADGDKIMALAGTALSAHGRPQPHPETCPTVLFFYGNGMCLNRCLELVDLWRRLGVNIVIPEYVGYGLSSGTPGEVGCQATASAAYAYLRENGVPTERLIIAGWSLGSAVAVHLASRKAAAGLMLFSPFTSMAAMARKLVPFLPLSPLLRHRFDSLSKISHVHYPIFLAHGSADPLVPASMSSQLKAAATGPVKLLILAGAGHDDVFDYDNAQLAPAMSEFMHECVHPVEAQPKQS